MQAIEAFRGRGRADSVVAAPVVEQFLKQVQEAAAASRATVDSKAKRKKKRLSASVDPDSTTTETFDDDEPVDDNDDIDESLMSPKTRARRKNRRTPRSSKAGSGRGRTSVSGVPSDPVSQLEACECCLLSIDVLHLIAMCIYSVAASAAKTVAAAAQSDRRAVQTVYDSTL